MQHYDGNQRDVDYLRTPKGEHVAVGTASLMAQRPLLDGGEGELLPRIDDMKLDTHDEQKILPMGATTSSLPPSGLPILQGRKIL